MGIAGGHNGQVYIYYKPYKKVADPDLLHNDIIYDIDILGIDIDRAHNTHYKEYGLVYEIVKGADNNEETE